MLGLFVRKKPDGPLLAKPAAVLLHDHPATHVYEVALSQRWAVPLGLQRLGLHGPKVWQLTKQAGILIQNFQEFGVNGVSGGWKVAQVIASLWKICGRVQTILQYVED